MFEDKHLLPHCYSEWLARAEDAQKDAEGNGDAVIKVFVDPDTFPEWCKKKGLKLDAEARSSLALEVAQSQSFSV